MDKIIRGIQKKVKKDSKQELKKLKVLEVADKVQDKKVDKCDMMMSHKKTPTAQKQSKMKKK